MPKAKPVKPTLTLPVFEPGAIVAGSVVICDQYGKPWHINADTGVISAVKLKVGQ